MNATQQPPSNMPFGQSSTNSVAPKYIDDSSATDSTTSPQTTPMAPPTPVPSEEPVKPQSSEPETAGLSEMDKEWVYRVRAVIEHTQGDPYTRSRELGKVRAEYLKVRFDKHTKLTEDQPK